MALFKLSEVSEEERKKYLQSIGIDADKFQNAQETKIKNEQKSDNLLPIETKNTDKFPIQEKNTTNNFPIKQKSENNTVTNKKLSEMVQGPGKENNNSPNRFNFRQVNQTANKNENKQLNAKVTTEKEQEQIKKAGGLEYDTNAIKEAMEINKDNSKGNINSSISHVLNGVLEGAKSNFAGVGQSALFPIANALRMAEEVTGKKQQAQEKDNEEELWSNKVLDMADYLKEESQHHSKVGSMLENNITRDLGNISNTVGNMAMSAISNVAIPGSGIMETGVSAGGNSAGETLNEDRSNLIQAIATGTAKGAVEGFTEKITGGNMLGKGSLDDLAENIIGNRIKSKAGKKIASKMYEFGGEILEEQISNNAGYVIDKIINNKDLPSFEQWINEANETTKNTFLTTLALNMLGMGGSTYKDSKIDIKDEQAQKYLNEAQKIIDNENIAENIKNNVTNQYNYKNTILSDLKASNLSNETKNEIQQYLKENNITEEQFNQISETLKQEKMSKEEQSNINSNEIKYQYEESDIENRKQEIINKAQQIEKTNPDFQGLADEIKNNYLGKDFDYNTYKQMNEYLDGIKPKEKDILEITTFNDSVDRRKTYMKYKNDTSDFNSNEVNLALDTIKANRNDKRTVSQWKKVAEQIGEQLAVNEKTAEEVENTAFKSWFDLQPTKNITRYDNKTKSNLGFQKFTVDDWVNTIYKTYNEQASKNVKQIQDNTINQTQQTIPTNKVENDIERYTPTRHEVVQKNREIAREHIENIRNWKDKSSGLKYQLETMERNMYDIIPDKEEAKKMIDTYFEPIHKSEAEKQKFINKYNDKIKEFKLNKYEAEAVQLLGEQKYNPNFKADEVKSVIEKVNKNIENKKINRQKVDNAIETFRNMYDELFELENKALRENGYKEKPYRKGYFPHFIDYVPETKSEKILNALGFKIDKRPLPTDIAGITEQFVPGKTWNRSALERKTNKTDYNALKGFDTYIAQASDNIFHTENIQKLRALENEIRYQYSDKGVQERIDNILNNDMLYEDEKQEQINAIFEQIENPMPNLVTELRRYTNALANKKSEADRSAENRYGRSIYNTVSAIENRFGANAVGLNIGSAITNFIPITQAWSQVSTKNMGRATIDTIKSFVTDDNFVDQSAFLTSRLRQSEKLYKTSLDKISDKTSFLFNTVDEVSSNIVVRGKYLENIEKGMSEAEAIKNADQFARNVIADRSKGALPTKFEEKNPVTKVFTQFQLEVNNQFRYMFKDIPRDLADEGLGAIAKAFFKMFVGAFIYNWASEKITGRKPAFSPIDIAVSTYKNFADDSKKTFDKLSDTATEIGEQLPFVGSLIGGGRVPVNGAIPNIANVTKGVTGLVTGEMDSSKAKDTIGKELSKPLYYLLPPFGGAQIKKSVEGISTVANGGSYGLDNKGNETLQIPVEDKSVKNYVKAGLFGKYALPEAKDYTEREYKSLNANQTKMYKESNLPYKQLLEYIDQKLKKDEDKVKYLESQDMTTEQKWGIYKYDLISSTKRSDGGTQLSDAEYMINNGVSKKEYMDAFDKAVKYNIDLPTQKEYIQMKQSGLKLDTYIDYKAKLYNANIERKINNLQKVTDEGAEFDTETKESLNTKEKIKVLQNANYTNEEKKAIYSNYIDKDDKTYSILNNTSKFDLDDYLDYKQQKFESDKEDDGTINGKTVSGSAKNKFYDYMDDSNFTYDQKLLLTGMKYKVTNTEREKIFDIIDDFNISKDDKLEIMSKMKGFTVYNNGRVSF